MQFLGGQVFIIFPGTQFLQVFVELVLHTLQGTFFFNEAYFLLFDGRFFGSDLRFEPDLFIVLGILLLVQVFVGDIESFERGLGQLNGYFLVFFFDLVELLRFFSLVLECL